MAYEAVAEEVAKAASKLEPCPVTDAGLFVTERSSTKVALDRDDLTWLLLSGRVANGSVGYMHACGRGHSRLGLSGWLY